MRLLWSSYGQTLVYVVVILLVGILVLYPVGMLIYGSFNSASPGLPGTLTLNNYRTAFGSPATWNAFETTLRVSFLSTLLALAVGVPLVWINTRTNTPFRSVLDTLNILPFLFSPYVAAVAWHILGNSQIGLLNGWLEGLGLPRLIDINSATGIVWVTGLYYVPFVYLTTSGAFRTLDPALEEASRVAGGNLWRTLRHVGLPLVLPAIASTALIVLVHSMGLFSVAAVLGMSRGVYVFTTRMFSYTSTWPTNYNAAAALATVLLAAALVGMYLQQLVIGRRRFTTVTGKGFRPRVIDLGPWKYVTLVFNVLYLVIGVFLPYFTLIVVSLSRYWPGYVDPSLFTFDNYATIFREMDFVPRSIRNSLLLAAGGGTIALLAGLVIAYLVVKSRSPLRRVLDFIANLPVAIPGMVIAVALLWAWIIVPLPIYGTLWILLIGYCTRYLPYGVRSITANLTQVGDELEESARVSGASWWGSLRHVMIPLLRPGLTAGWVLLFIMFVRELDVSILLYSYNAEVIPVALWTMQQNGTYGTMGAMALVQTGLLLLGVLVFRIVARESLVKRL